LPRGQETSTTGSAVDSLTHAVIDGHSRMEANRAAIQHFREQHGGLAVNEQGLSGAFATGIAVVSSDVAEKSSWHHSMSPQPQGYRASESGADVVMGFEPFPDD